MKKITILFCASLLIFTGFFSGCFQQNTTRTQLSMTPTIFSFNATKDTIDKGMSTELHWVVTKATNVTIDNGIGAVPLTGSQVVSPKHTTEYTLEASNQGWPTAAFATITVVSHDLPLLVGTWQFQSGHPFWNVGKLILYANGTGMFTSEISTTIISNFNLRDGYLSVHYGTQTDIMDYELQNNNNALLITMPGTTTSAAYVRE